MFTNVDVDERARLDKRKLQARRTPADAARRLPLSASSPQVVLNCLMLHDKPADVMSKYGSRDGGLLLEVRPPARTAAGEPSPLTPHPQELVLFVSNVAKTAGKPLVLLVPPDLLRDIRVGYERLGTGKDGRPHLQARRLGSLPPRARADPGRRSWRRWSPSWGWTWSRSPSTPSCRAADTTASPSCPCS